MHKFKGYNYHHIDDEDCFLPFRYENIETGSQHGGNEKKEIIRAFLDAGWEGDGEINEIYLPPFVFINLRFSNGVTIFHVKQMNNGSSFLAVPEDWIEYFEEIFDRN